MKSKLAKGSYNSSTLGELGDDFSKLVDMYDRESVGPNRNKTLCEYLKALQYAIFQSVSDTVSTEASKEAGQAIKRKANFEMKQKEYESRIRNLEDRLNRFEDDGKDYEDQIKKLEQQNREMDGNLQEAAVTVQELK